MSDIMDIISDTNADKTILPEVIWQLWQGHRQEQAKQSALLARIRQDAMRHTVKVQQVRPVSALLDEFWPSLVNSEIH